MGNAFAFVLDIAPVVVEVRVAPASRRRQQDFEPPIARPPAKPRPHGRVGHAGGPRGLPRNPERPVGEPPQPPPTASGGGSGPPQPRATAIRSPRRTPPARDT